MAIKIATGIYECSYCGKKFSIPTEADACRDNHDLIYIALTKEDLNRLLNFLVLKDEELLTPTLIKSLRKHSPMQKGR